MDALRRWGLAMLVLVGAGLPAAEPDTAGLTQTLAATVKGGRVDYRGLQGRSQNLDTYLAAASKVKRSDFDAWAPAARKAFLINVYNVATLRLVLDHYPVRSIKDIGSFFSTPWKIPVVRLFGREQTLDEVEGALRGMGDPRIHFAIVCASKSCPYLAAVAYSPANLDEMLEANAKAFLADPVRNRYNGGQQVLWLSPIFDWFGKDFAAIGGVRAFVAAHASGPAMAKAALDSTQIKWTHYDWTLNEQGTSTEREKP